jgi:inorganic triphosphatase YgiF
MSAPREVELKLAVSANNIARLNRSSLLKGAATASRKPATLVSVYFDTDKLKLRRNGLSLRVRRIDRRHVQTIKEETGESAALFARNEWEHDVSGERPDLDIARNTALEPLLSKKLRRGLRPVFETRVRRRVYPIHRGHSEVELTIDRGQIEAGRQSSPLCEVELELKQGEAAELFKLARELSEQVPLQVAVNSKADRGYALITGEQPAAVRVAPVASRRIPAGKPPSGPSRGPACVSSSPMSRQCKAVTRKLCTRCGSPSVGCARPYHYFPICL